MRTIVAVIILLASVDAVLSAPRHIFNQSSGLWPIGFSYYCMDNPTECEPLAPGGSTAPLEYGQWKVRLESVNARTNSSITYTPELADRWTLAPKRGDCDDYALTKRDELIKLGVSKGALHMAFALMAWGEPHVVLLVDTTEGQKVLDNLTDEVYDLEQMMAQRLSIQDAIHPRNWTQIF